MFGSEGGETIQCTVNVTLSKSSTSRFHLHINVPITKHDFNVLIMLNDDRRCASTLCFEQACDSIQVLVEEAPMNIFNATQLVQNPKLPAGHIRLCFLGQPS